MTQIHNSIYIFVAYKTHLPVSSVRHWREGRVTARKYSTVSVVQRSALRKGKSRGACTTGTHKRRASTCNFIQCTATSWLQRAENTCLLSVHTRSPMKFVTVLAAAHVNNSAWKQLSFKAVRLSRPSPLCVTTPATVH